MKIINAVWEKRNIGCDAYEIILDTKDLKDFAMTLKQIREQNFSNSYVVIKMPVKNLCVLHALEDEGFHFMETQFHMKKVLQDYETPKIITNLKNILEQKEICKNFADWKQVTDLMTDNMFYTDRIYLDPKLAPGTSCKRYQNWILDLVNDERAHLFGYYYKNTLVGLGLIKINLEEKIVYDLLEGILEKYQNTGFGYMMFDRALKSYQNLGMVRLETSISSNNLSIIKLDQTFGYLIEGEDYVLRKFNKGDL